METKIKIYQVIEREFNENMGFFEGWEKLRAFAEQTILYGWNTDWEIHDLKDEKSVIVFLNEEWGADVNLIMEVNLLNYLNPSNNINIPIYYYEDENNIKVYDFEEMTKEFELALYQLERK
jgi:hypothetical protein